MCWTGDDDDDWYFTATGDQVGKFGCQLRCSKHYTLYYRSKLLVIYKIYMWSNCMIFQCMSQYFFIVISVNLLMNCSKLMWAYRTLCLRVNDLYIAVSDLAFRLLCKEWWGRHDHIPKRTQMLPWFSFLLFYVLDHVKDCSWGCLNTESLKGTTLKINVYHFICYPRFVITN